MSLADKLILEGLHTLRKMFLIPWFFWLLLWFYVILGYLILEDILLFDNNSFEGVKVILPLLLGEMLLLLVY